MLDLIQLSPRSLFPPGGRDLYRQIAVLTGMGEGTEVLDVGCGKGVSLEFFVREYGVHGSGIERDPRLVQAALDRVREQGLSDRLQVQRAPADALPYRDAIFDVSVGELGMTAGADAATAVDELVRVTRPGGCVILVQLVWTAPVEPERRNVLARHLGVHPRMLVEWKRMLREAGVRDLHTEDWTDPETSFRARIVKPFPDFAELFSLPEKVGIMGRAWSRWGWTGVRTAVAREREVHKLLTQERVLALDLIKGTRTVAEPEPATGEPAPGDESRGADAPDPESPEQEPPSAQSPETEPPTTGEPRPDTRDLPLFTPDDS